MGEESLARIDIFYTSKDIHEEALPCFFKERVRYINLCYFPHLTYYLTQDLANLLQKISLRIHYDAYKLFPKSARDLLCLEHLRKFTGSAIPRKSCVILSRRLGMEKTTLIPPLSMF